ncbi:MAG: hypothetical protein OXK80_00085, partial [Bdellovibrionales bacterium]|nr:hypothetical protein [Bdellovibrionales bacterium]
TYTLSYFANSVSELVNIYRDDDEAVQVPTETAERRFTGMTGFRIKSGMTIFVWNNFMLRE